MSNSRTNITIIPTVKAIRGEYLLIDLQETYKGDLISWMKRSPNDASYRSFEIIDNRFLKLSQEKASDYYDQGELIEEIKGKWEFDVEQILDPAKPEDVQTIVRGVIIFTDDITGSEGYEPGEPVTDLLASHLADETDPHKTVRDDLNSSNVFTWSIDKIITWVTANFPKVADTLRNLTNVLSSDYTYSNFTRKVDSFAALEALTNVKLGDRVDTVSWHVGLNVGGNSFTCVDDEGGSLVGNGGTIASCSLEGAVWRAKINGEYLDAVIFGICNSNPLGVTYNSDKLNAANLYIHNSSEYKGIEINEDLIVNKTINFQKINYKSKNTIYSEDINVSDDVLVFGIAGEVAYENAFILGASAKRSSFSGAAISGAAVKVINITRSTIVIGKTENTYRGFEIYAEHGCNHNKITIDSHKNHKEFIKLNPILTTSGNINENIWYGGDFKQQSSKFTTPTYFSLGTSNHEYAISNNIFIKPSLEATVVDGTILIDFINAKNNKFIGVRNEIGAMTNQQVVFGGISIQDQPLNNEVEFYKKQNIKIVRNNVKDTSIVKYYAELEITESLQKITAQDIYYHSEFVSEATNDYHRSVKGRVTSLIATTINSIDSDTPIRLVKNKGSFSTYDTTLTIGNYINVGQQNITLRIKIKSSGGARLMLKPFDENGDLMLDGISTSHSGTWETHWFQTTVSLAGTNYVDILLNGDVKVVFVGVASNPYGGEIEEFDIIGKNISLYYANLKSKFLSAIEPKLGWFDEGDVYYDELDLTKGWSCTTSGDFSGVPNLPVFEEFNIMKKGVSQADSTATDVTGLVADFNTLLQNRRDANQQIT